MAMGKSSRREKHLARQVSFALAVGLFGMLSKAHAMPTGGKVELGNAQIDGSDPTHMNIKNGSLHNIINWQDFSIANGEKVTFDDNHYMNIVTGKATSRIDGILEGGKDIYVINPNGVIFGQTAQVNVGNLYVSTREATDTMKNAFTSGSAGAVVLSAGGGALNADVVSLVDTAGVIQVANQVVMEGRNIRFLNVDAVKDVSADRLKLRSKNYDDNTGNGYIHVGYDKEAGTSLSRYEDLSSTSENYQIIRKPEEWKAINTDVDGLKKNYMLADDLDFKGVEIQSIGSATGNRGDLSSGKAFEGKIDGMFHAVKNFTMNAGNDSFSGLFAYTSGARIENIGIENATLSAGYIGGIVGYAKNSRLINVWNEKSTINISTVGGGLVGFLASNSRIDSSYNTATVKGDLVGGLVYELNNGKIYNCYNTGTAKNGVLYRIKNDSSANEIRNVYTTQDNISSVNPVQSTHVVTNATSKNQKDYAFDSISNEGGANTTWRIYENESLPLLTAFFKGTVSTEYTYAGDTGDVHVSAGTYKPDDLPHKTYNGEAVLSDKSSLAVFGAGASVDDVTLNNEDKDIHARTFALFSTGQQGYDIYGGNFKINQREISFQADETTGKPLFTKAYDGTVDAKDAVLAALSAAENGTVTGIVDKDKDRITLDFNGITATYNSANVRDATTVTISGANENMLKGDTYDDYILKVDGINGAHDGKITARKVSVGFEGGETRLDKVYDGTADAAYKELVLSDQNFDGDAVDVKALIDKSTVKLDTSSVKNQYITEIKNDGTATTAVNVVDTANGDRHVAYVGIGLTNNDDGNFELVDQDGKSLQNVKVTDANGTEVASGKTLTLDGKITPRTILSESIQLQGQDGAPSREYNGKPQLEIDSNKMSVTVGNQVFTGDQTGQGLLKGDADKVSFLLTGNATFYDASGEREESNATGYNGTGTGAQMLKYDVQLDDKTANDETRKIVANYQIKNSIDDPDTAPLAYGETYGIAGKGEITPRKIQVEMGTNSGIDKEYDGNANVVDKQYLDFGHGYAQYADKGKTILDADVFIDVKAEYQGKGTFGGKDVAYDGENITTKDILYTLTLGGSEKSGNYLLVAGDPDKETGSQSVTLDATGKITPRVLNVNVDDDVVKTYDGTADMSEDWSAKSTITLDTSNMVSGEEDSVSLVYEEIQGQYGVKTEETAGIIFDPNANVGAKDVRYTGLALDGNKNYTIADTVYGVGMITKASISKDAFDKNPDAPELNKTYDGLTDVMWNDDYDWTWADFLQWQKSIPDAMRNDFTVTIDKAQSRYDSKDYNDAGKNVTIAFSVTIDDTKKANYDIGDFKFEVDGYKGNIERKTVNVTLKADKKPTKAYDGTTDVILAPDESYNDYFDLDGVIDSEKNYITIGTVAALYADKNASEKVGVSYSQVGLASSSNDAPTNNYEVVLRQKGEEGKLEFVNELQGVGSITKRTVWVSAEDVDRDYDPTAGAAVTGKTGTNSANQSYNDTIRIKVDNQALWELLNNEGFSDENGYLTGIIKGEYQNKDKDGVANVLRDDDKNVIAQDVLYTGILSALRQKDGHENYEIGIKDGNYDPQSDTLKGKGTITPVSVSIDENSFDLKAFSQVYDGSTAVQNAVNQLDYKGNDTLKNLAEEILSVSGVFDEKNVGEDKHVTFEITIKGQSNGNYELTVASGTDKTIKKEGNFGTITPKSIYVFFDNVDETTQKQEVKKVYDGNTNVILNDIIKGWVKQDADSSFVDRDNVALKIEGSYKDANASDEEKDVTYMVSLAGDDAENYRIYDLSDKGEEEPDKGQDVTFAGKKGTIERRKISVSFLTGENDTVSKAYDGNADVGENDGPNAFTPVWGIVNGDVKDSGIVSGDAKLLWIATGEGGLKSQYGTWDPNTGSGEANPHVQRDENGDPAWTDVKYENFKLINQDTTQDVARNYELVNDFYVAKGKGQITPREIEIKDVKDDWVASVEKVYDGTSNVINGFKSDGTKIAGISDYLKIYWEDPNGSGTKVYFDYDVADNDVQYDGKDAGTHNITCENIQFAETTWGDFKIDATARNALEEKYQKVEGKDQGTILRRLLVVSPEKTEEGQGGNQKVYDGTETLATDKAYNDPKNFVGTENDRITGLVGQDTVSITYTANFNTSDASVDPDAGKEDAGWTAKTVTYAFKLDGDMAKNYTLTPEGQKEEDKASTKTETVEGAITKREVYVDFVNGDETGFDQVYNGSDTRALTDAEKKKLELKDNGKDTGIINSDTVRLNFDKSQVHYAGADVATDGQGKVTTKTVYIENLALDGEAAKNYVLRTEKKDDNGNYVLEGSGTIDRRQIAVSLTKEDIKKVYDRSSVVEDYMDDAGELHKYLTDNITAVDVLTGDTMQKPDYEKQLGLKVVEAVYLDPDTKQERWDAGDGLGVRYLLKWDSQNYELVRVAKDSVDSDKETYESISAFDAKGGQTELFSDKGEIEKLKLTYNKDITGVDKEYDGTTDVLDTSVVDAIFSNVIDEDKLGFLTVTSGEYKDANTGAEANEWEGVIQSLQIGFTLSENAAKNYVLWALNDTDQVEAKNPVDGKATSGTYTGFGHINRRKVTLTPDGVVCYPDELPLTYTGSVSGLPDGLSLPGGLVLTWGRAPAQDGVAAGLYPLFGYANGALVPMGAPYYYYNNLQGGSSGNFYFETAKNSALEILARPVQPVLPGQTDRLPEGQVIADIQFTPDDLSYNRGAMDPDGVHFGYLPEAEVRYTGSGVHAEDAEGSLFSDAMLSGRGDIVNLDGAAAWTPEEAAAEAAQPMDEAFGMELVNEDSESGSMSMLDILTRASEKRTRGQGIVIDAMEEDEEEEEEQRKARGMMMANRANIGIEASGDGVNLDALLG